MMQTTVDLPGKPNQ